MIFVDNQGKTDPSLNLAAEEYLLRQVMPGEDILLFYINEPSIIIGRNQNTLEEINQSYVEAHQIHVVRRLSGGGAVYHDLGNLNFSFISPNTPENVLNFQKFTAPVIRCLRDMGVAAELSGRNDIVVDGRKISGNAQYIAGKRMVSHGTLLFDSDLSRVSEALNVKQSKIASKGIKSVRSRVANISEFLVEPMDIKAFRTRLLYSLFESGRMQEYRLTGSDWQAILTLADERYRRWDWNYGRSPDFNVQKTQRFPGGEIEARIDVQAGFIQQVKFYGDFFGQGDLSELEAKLAGARYTSGDLAAALKDMDVSLYFSGLSNQELLDLLY
ncbi:MAG TPA: lipoate--protein ligase [Anaerolineales bacterium]